MPVTDITSLAETAIRRQKDLKMLPYAVLRMVLGYHGIRLLPGIQNKDVLTDFQRKSGILKPYDSGVAITHSDVGKANEMILQVEKAYASVKDNIQKLKNIPGKKRCLNLSLKLLVKTSLMPCTQQYAIPGIKHLQGLLMVSIR